MSGAPTKRGAVPLPPPSGRAASEARDAAADMPRPRLAFGAPAWAARPLLAPPASRTGLAALGLALGAAMGLGQVPFAAWWLALPALAWAIAVLLPLGAPRAALFGLAFGTGQFGVALQWIVEPFLVDAARYGWMAPFAVVGLSVFMASYWALATGLAAWLARPPVPRALLVAAALALSEMVRARAFTGFAWASPAYIWSETPVYQALAWVGPHGLTLLSALVAAALALGALRAVPPWAPAGALLAGAAVALWGAVREIPPAAPDAPVIRLVQPNAVQRLKWDPEWMAEFLRRGIESSAAPAGPLGTPDLVVWPEASVPTLLADAGPILEAVARATGGAPAALGVTRSEGGRLYNSLALTGPRGEVVSIYDKHHLVPFGEFFPFSGLASRVGLRGLAAGDGVGYAPGPGPRVIDIAGVGLALPLICYEAVFPRDTRVTPRPRLMLQITNDAWFGTFAGPYQHLAQARARAIEQGLPVLRAANTGVSAAIDAGGRVIDSLPLGAAGHIDTALPAALPPTLYARTGDAPLGMGLGVLLGAVALRRARRA